MGKQMGQKPVPENSATDYGETIRVSTEVAYICRWLRELEPGNPTTKEIIQWAAIDNLRVRFAPYEDEAKKLAAIEDEANQRKQKVKEAAAKKKRG